jgi:hypothetical protein
MSFHSNLFLSGFSPIQLFNAGEQGVWYDPSDYSSMFQDSAGTIAVTGLEQPVGLLLDKSGRGNDASQSSASRPVLSARYNLLTQTEAFDDAAWTKSDLTAVDGATDPNGGALADTLTASGANGTATQSVTAAAAAHVFSVWLRRKTGTGNVDITCHSGGTWVTQTITSSWARYSVTQTLTAGSRTPGVRIVTSGDEVEAFGADLRVTNDGVGLPAYQRVGAATAGSSTAAGTADYDTTGFPPYLRFDGTDDSMATGTITPGIDKAQVFAGVRKLSDAALRVLAEFSASWVANNGSFIVTAPGKVSPNGDYSSGSRGDAAVDANQAAETGTIVAPNTNVIAVTHDISGDLTAIRSNGIQLGTATGNKGAGDFLAYPLYIGSRAGSSFRYNGRIYSLIVRFGANLDATTITNTETWVNGKTKAYV